MNLLKLLQIPVFANATTAAKGFNLVFPACPQCKHKTTESWKCTYCHKQHQSEQSIVWTYRLPLVMSTSRCTSKYVSVLGTEAEHWFGCTAKQWVSETNGYGEQDWGKWAAAIYMYLGIGQCELNMNMVELWRHVISNPDTAIDNSGQLESWKCESEELGCGIVDDIASCIDPISSFPPLFISDEEEELWLSRRFYEDSLVDDQQSIRIQDSQQSLDDVDIIGTPPGALLRQLEATPQSIIRQNTVLAPETPTREKFVPETPKAEGWVPETPVSTRRSVKRRRSKRRISIISDNYPRKKLKPKPLKFI